MSANDFSKDDLVFVNMNGVVFLGRVKRIDGGMVTVGPPGLAHTDTILSNMPLTDMCVVERRYVKAIPSNS